MAGLTATQNYLVPASGSTHGYPVNQTFSATPFNIDFRNVELDGQPFVPSGAFIDNSQGTGDLVITIGVFGFRVVCPSGGIMATQYPAPVDQSVSITGNGAASIVFVDFPVIPFLQVSAQSIGSVDIPDGQDVAQGSTTDPVASAPLTDPWTVISLLKLIASTQPVPDVAPATGTVSNFAITTVSQIALAANAGRQGATFFNDSAVSVYLLLSGAGPAAPNTCTVKIQPGGVFVLNKGEYTGLVFFIGDAAGGTFRVTEFTA